MSVEMEHTPEQPPDVDLTGKVIAGRYNVLRRLGEGGMGVVYSAMDSRLEKQVAIKVLKEDFATRPDVVARFTQEAKSAARIKHENVLDVTDYGGTEDGSFYIAMEMLVGTDLADVLHKEGAVELHRALNIALQVTRALGAAHGKGIVHRDLKPENIFLVRSDDNREVVKIVDFGIAQMKDMTGQGQKKLTQTGMIFGTPEYMSPEQAKGAPIDHRVDVYAVGVILYEMAAGRTPFVGDSFMGILTQHLYEPAPAITSLNPQAQITPEYESVIAKALAKDPEQRYQSMQELGEDLLKIRDGSRPTAITAVISNPTRPNTTIALTSSTNTGSFIGANQTIEMNSMKKPQTSPVRLVVIGLATLAVFVGGAFLALKLLEEKPHTQVNVRGVGENGTAADAGVQSAQNTQQNSMLNSDAGIAVALGADALTAPDLLRVHFVTNPPGAQVFFQGSENAVCAATPCDVNVARGESRQGYASLRNKRGEFTVTASSDGQEVTVALAVRRPTGNGSQTRPNGNGNNANTHGRLNPACRPGQLQYFDRAERIFRPCSSG